MEQLREKGREGGRKGGRKGGRERQTDRQRHRRRQIYNQERERERERERRTDRQTERDSVGDKYITNDWGRRKEKTRTHPRTKWQFPSSFPPPLPRTACLHMNRPRLIFARNLPRPWPLRATLLCCCWATTTCRARWRNSARTRTPRRTPPTNYAWSLVHISTRSLRSRFYEVFEMRSQARRLRVVCVGRETCVIVCVGGVRRKVGQEGDVVGWKEGGTWWDD